MQARYISEEVKDKSNRVINTSSWHEELVDDIPLQQNGYVLLIVMMILSF
jgi:sentrin-specific protease 1